MQALATSSTSVISADIRELKTDLSNRSEEESPTLPGDEALEEQRIAETDYVDNISTKQSDECETGSSVTSSVPIPTKSPLQESDQYTAKEGHQK